MDEQEFVDIVEQMEQQQPTRTGKTRPPRRFDKTQLKSNHHGKYVHRDYAAHFFRWGWVSRHVKRGARILEVGCGQELSLVHVLSGNMSCIPEVYVGCDLNKIDLEAHSVPRWATIHSEFDFVSNFETWVEGGAGKFYDVGVNFEVIEHMQPPDGRRMLEGFRELLKPGALLFLSTPVFDGKAAVNHVHEYTIPELRDLIESVGFKVNARYGTFASARDIKKAALPEHLKAYTDLEDFFGGDVLSTFLAPLYPDASRNNLWVLENEK